MNGYICVDSNIKGITSSLLSIGMTYDILIINSMILEISEFFRLDCDRVIQKTSYGMIDFKWHNRSDKTLKVDRNITDKEQYELS
jgi:hypothetical protein